MAEVTLGYSPSKGQYHVDEIRGSWPTACYQHVSGPPLDELVNSSDEVQVETVTVHVGDWLTEAEAGNLGARTHLTVRPYRVEE